MPNIVVSVPLSLQSKRYHLVKPVTKSIIKPRAKLIAKPISEPETKSIIKPRAKLIAETVREPISEPETELINNHIDIPVTTLDKSIVTNTANPVIEPELLLTFPSISIGSPFNAPKVESKTEQFSGADQANVVMKINGSIQMHHLPLKGSADTITPIYINQYGILCHESESM